MIGFRLGLQSHLFGAGCRLGEFAACCCIVAGRQCCLHRSIGRRSVRHLLAQLSARLAPSCANPGLCALPAELSTRSFALIPSDRPSTDVVLPLYTSATVSLQTEQAKVTPRFEGSLLRGGAVAISLSFGDVILNPEAFAFAPGLFEEIYRTFYRRRAQDSEGHVGCEQ
jgi:hypothetical protein